MANFCEQCPNLCKADRNNGVGACGTDNQIKIAKYYLHPFEEPPVSGKNGSGTVFFCGCSLKCVFCQNFEVSRNLTGKVISPKELADIFRELENRGAHNINLVNPTHYWEQIIEALKIYRPNIPIVANTHGYERVEVLEKVNPYIDVYLPDMKYFSESLSMRYSKKKNYFSVCKKAIEFMIKSKPLIFDGELIKQGVIVRHLILPQGTSDSKKIVEWFSEFKDSAYLSLMSQYTPFGEIDNYPELKRKVTKREYDGVVDYALSLGIENMFIQDTKSSSTEYIPQWDF